MARVRVGILSATLGHVLDSYRLPTAEALQVAAGRNTGNLAFRYAVSRHVASPAVHVPWGADPGWVRDVCDLLVIPSANQANPHADFGPRADFLEAVDLPCLAVGLGAQAAELGAAVAFPPGTRRYLRALADRSHTIGVRGPYSADVLARIGVRNTVVIGCPSNFINPSPTLGAAVESAFRRERFSRLAVTAGDLTPGHRRVERRLFGWLSRRGVAYICQSHPALVALARNRLDEVSAADVDRIGRYLQSTARRLTRSKFLAAVRDRFRVFFDAGAWLEYLAGCDLSVGARIHGNLLAVQAGTPGICVYHDARTQELCQTIGLPSLSVGQFLSARRPEDLVELAGFDGASYDRQRAALAREYRDLLVGRGVEVSDLLTRLTDAGP